MLLVGAIAGSDLLREQMRLDPTYLFFGGQIRGAPLVARASHSPSPLAASCGGGPPALVVAGIAGRILHNAFVTSPDE